jgi:hypothetical protein
MFPACNNLIGIGGFQRNKVFLDFDTIDIGQIIGLIVIQLRNFVDFGYIVIIFGVPFGNIWIGVDWVSCRNYYVFLVCDVRFHHFVDVHNFVLGLGVVLGV